MKILEFILLLVATTSFLVYEKIPLSTYETKTKKELKEIGALHGLEQLTFSDFEYQKNSITYQLSSIKSKAVFFNVNMLSTSIDTESSVVLYLSWSPRSGETNYISPYHSIYSASFSKKSNSLKSEAVEIEFEVEVSQFTFSKKWTYTDDNFYIPSGSIDNTYISFKVKCLSESPYDEELLLEVINAFLTENRNKMNEAFATDGVNAYYKGLPFELVQKVYTQTSTNIVYENNIDLTLESAPEYANNKDLIFKRKGKLNDLDIDGSVILSDSSSYQKFYINKALIQNLISQNLFNIIFEQTNNPSPKYELTVAYLRQIMDVSSSYSDSTELKVNAEMTNVDFNNEDAISGTLTFEVSVIEKDNFDSLLDFTLNIGFEFTPTLFQNGLNFVLLGKNVSIKGIKATQTLRDQALLLSWIENTYLVSLGNNEFNLFSLSLNLSPYFSNNKLGYEFTNDYLCITKL